MHTYKRRYMLYNVSLVLFCITFRLHLFNFRFFDDLILEDFLVEVLFLWFIFIEFTDVIFCLNADLDLLVCLTLMDFTEDFSRLHADLLIRLTFFDITDFNIYILQELVSYYLCISHGYSTEPHRQL